MAGFGFSALITAINLVNFNCLDSISRSLGLESGTYPLLASKIWGSFGKYLVSVLIWCAQISVFVGAFLMTTEIIRDLFCLDSESQFCLPRSKIVLVISILSLFIATIPSLKTFAYISTLSMGVIFVSLVIIFVQNCRSLHSGDAGPVSLESKSLFLDLSFVPQSLGILLYSFEGITLYLPLRDTYKGQKNFHGFFVWTMVFVALFVFMVSVPSYFFFFDRTREIIFLNFSPSHVYLHLMKICYLTMVFLSNPINLFPLYRSFLTASKVSTFLQSKSKIFNSFFKLFLRILVTLLCILIAAFVSSFIKFISFVGSFFFSLLGIVIPVLLYLVHFYKSNKLKTFDAILKGLTLVISLALFGISSVFSFEALIQSK